MYNSFTINSSNIFHRIGNKRGLFYFGSNLQVHKQCIHNTCNHSLGRVTWRSLLRKHILQNTNSGKLVLLW